MTDVNPLLSRLEDAAADYLTARASGDARRWRTASALLDDALDAYIAAERAILKSKGPTNAIED